MNYRRNVVLPRFMAAFIDVVITSFILTITQIFYRPFAFFDDNVQEIASVVQQQPETADIVLGAFIALIVGLVLYVYIPYTKDGKTIGKILMRIRAIDAYGRPPSLAQHFIRAIALYWEYVYMILLLLLLIDFEVFMLAEAFAAILYTAILIISAAMIIGDRYSRGLHDILAKTYVVDENYDPNLDEEGNPTTIRNWAFKETKDRDDDFLNIYDENNPWNKR